MSVRNQLQVNSIDSKYVSLLLKQRGGVVLRRYQSVVTLKLDDQLEIHIVDQSIGNGPRRLVLNPLPHHSFITFSEGLRVKLKPYQIEFSHGVIVDWSNAKVWQPKPIQKQQHLTRGFLKYLQTRATVMEQTIANPFATEIEFVKKKIVQFLESPNLENINAIIGLGSGSTPIGDDAVLGYILARRFFGQSLTLLHPWMNQSPGTTPLSIEMLRDAYLGEYSELFINWLTSLQKETNQEIDMKIAQLGGNSGAMILKSFYSFSIQILKENQNEYLSTYTR